MLYYIYTHTHIYIYIYIYKIYKYIYIYIYIYMYICAYYVYRSELKLRSVRTAIYRASLLCCCTCESCVGQKKKPRSALSWARDGVFLVYRTRWETGRLSRGSKGSLMANGHREWLPFAIEHRGSVAVLRLTRNEILLAVLRICSRAR